MKDYGMFSEDGNAQVASMLTIAEVIKTVAGEEAAIDYALSSLRGMTTNGFEEAEDTMVRDIVINEIKGY